MTENLVSAAIILWLLAGVIGHGALSAYKHNKRINLVDRFAFIMGPTVLLFAALVSFYVRENIFGYGIEFYPPDKGS